MWELLVCLPDHHWVGGECDAVLVDDGPGDVTDHHDDGKRTDAPLEGDKVRQRRAAGRAGGAGAGALDTCRAGG